MNAFSLAEWKQWGKRQDCKGHPTVARFTFFHCLSPQTVNDSWFRNWTTRDNSWISDFSNDWYASLGTGVKSCRNLSKILMHSLLKVMAKKERHETNLKFWKSRRITKLTAQKWKELIKAGHKSPDLEIVILLVILFYSRLVTLFPDLSCRTVFYKKLITLVKATIILLLSMFPLNPY